MLRDHLVGLIVPMRNCGTQALGDEFSYLENPRPVGAESSLTGRCSSPFQTEPRQKDEARTRPRQPTREIVGNLFGLPEVKAACGLRFVFAADNIGKLLAFFLMDIQVG